MNRATYREYTKERPYKVWIRRKNGTKFLAHFKTKSEADKYAKAVGHTYTKANVAVRKKRTTTARKGDYLTKMLWG